MNTNLNYLKKLELFKELDHLKEGAFFAVIDQKIKNHLPQWIQFSPHVYWLKNSEGERCLDGYTSACDFFLKQGIRNDSVLYAFGGGATLDFTGFLAATILQGMKWMAVPTSLFAMINAPSFEHYNLNSEHGKNLLGISHDPEKFIICVDFINSLPEQELLKGKSEIIRYGFLSKPIYELITRKSEMMEIISACINYRNGINSYSKNNLDHLKLNLGVTFGKAIEDTLQIPFGQALIMGIKYKFELFYLNDALAPWGKLVTALGLVEENFSLEKLKSDSMVSFIKKIENQSALENNKLKLVFVKDIGSCYLEEIQIKELKERIQSFSPSILS